MILEVQIQIFGACQWTHVKVFIFKKFQGAQIFIFFVKISMKLPFTLKNKHRKQILNLSFKNFYFGPPEKVRFWFLKKNPQTNFFFVFWLWFRFKTIENICSFGIFENAGKKAISCPKRHFGRFSQLLIFFKKHFKNIDKIKKILKIFFFGFLDTVHYTIKNWV